MPIDTMPPALCPVCGEELVRQDPGVDREAGDACMCCEYFKPDKDRDARRAERGERQEDEP